MQNEKRSFYAVVVVLIILISIFFVVVQYQLKSITEKEEDKQSLEVTIIADKGSGTSPLKVNFKPLVLNEKGEVRFTWDFGNGITSNEENPTYTYIEEGEYVCKLMIENGNRRQNDSYNIIVLPNNPPDVKIIVDSTGFRPATIKFDAQVFEPEGENVEYKWEIKYPLLLSSEKIEEINEKSFTKKFWRPGNYVATLTVTDESGNSVTEFKRIQISKSQIELFIQSFTFTSVMFKTIWPIIDPFVGPVLYEFLDDNWLNFPPLVQRLSLFLLNFLGISYDPPIEKADLFIMEIDEINHSTSVNESGAVSTKVSISSPIIIKNNDSSNVAKNVYLTLVDPLSDEKGLHDEINREELTVSINVGGVTKQLFYNGEYKNYKDCVLIDNLAYGDLFTGEITVTLNNADSGTFKDNEIYSCNLYIYQEKADFVEAIPFEIIT